MYKVSIEHLQAFKDALIKSNQLLKMIGAEGETDEFDVVIDENKKQINIITNKFYINE
jgi:hypothetical protein